MAIRLNWPPVAVRPPQSNRHEAGELINRLRVRAAARRDRNDAWQTKEVMKLIVEDPPEQQRLPGRKRISKRRIGR